MYAKVFASLWNGTLRGMPSEQLVFIYLLAHSDEDGVVDIIVDKIIDDTGLEAGDVRRAIEILESPDKNSRSTEDDGRRLLPLYEHGAWGWRIVNHSKYRTLRNEEERRRQNREAQAKRRSQHLSASVSNGQHESALSAHTDADADAETEQNLLSIEDGRERENGSPSRPKRQKTDRSPRDVEWAESFSGFWEEYPRRQKRPEAERAWMKLPLRGKEGFDQVLLGLYRWQASEQWKDPQYVPLPATWLNAHQYEDDIPEVNHAS